MTLIQALFDRQGVDRGGGERATAAPAGQGDIRRSVGGDERVLGFAGADITHRHADNQRRAGPARRQPFEQPE